MKRKLFSVSWRILMLGLGILGGGLLLLLLLFIYAVPNNIFQAEALRSELPFPIAVVSYRAAVSFGELADNTAAVRRFYENQDFSQIGLRVDFSTAEGKKRLKVREKEVLNKMLEDEAIEILAKGRGIRITEEAARNGLLRALEEYGSEVAVKENLARLYGWTLDDFQKKIVLPGLYEEKLVERFQEEVDIRGAARERIKAAEQALREKKSFADTAKEFSEGETAGEGGSLGWFSLSELAPELQNAVSSQAVGQAGEVVESSLGFHIVLVNEKKTEQDEDLYRLSQIFTPKMLFSDWLSAEMRNLAIFVWSPDYRYNAALAQVEFQSPEMRDFEKKIREEKNGDAVFSF